MIDKRYNNVIDLSTYWWRKGMQWAKAHKWPVFSFVDASGQEVRIDTPEAWAEWLGPASNADIKALVNAQKAADAGAYAVNS